MGSVVVLESENLFEAGRRGEAVDEPPCCREKVDGKDIEELLQIKCYNLRSSNDNHRELRISSTSNTRWKSMPDRPHGANARSTEVVKEGLQDSTEVKRTKLRDGRKSVDQAFSDESFLSFDVVDPLPQPSANKCICFPQPTESAQSIEFPELSFRDLPQERIKLSSSCSGSSPHMDCLEDNVMEFGLHSRKGSVDEQKSDRNQVFRTETDDSIPFKRDIMNNLSKSLSEKGIFKGSPKSQLSPFKKMLDPIMKSKSLRNPSQMETKTATDPPGTKRHRAFHKSLLNDFHRATDKIDYDDGWTETNLLSEMISSPAHLHAILNLDFKHGALSYEFAVKDQDVIFAKTWRTNSAFNWVYTFHSCKKKSVNHSAKSSPIIGQMQVSCFLCSEVSDTGSLESSTVTEFVLYDISHARRSYNIEEGTIGESHGHPSYDLDPDPSTSYPWARGDLHTFLEIASIVIQIPFNRKEMKQLRVEEDTLFECINQANVKAVIPSGHHGLPSKEEGSPSSLLDRWRFGGGCDCGGWDMACPITVLDRPHANDVKDHSAKGSQQQMALFVQGRKEEIPTLSLIADGKGQFSVDFHAQLSSLQAFSICIAILHSSEAASALGHRDNKQRLYSNSLKLMLEEEVKHLLDAVAEEEKRKAKNKIDHLPPSFILDSPFSPMGRL